MRTHPGEGMRTAAWAGRVTDWVVRWTQPVAVLLVVVGAVAVFGVTYFAPVSYAASDPELSLLVAQGLIEHRTLRLDAYAAGVNPPLAQYNTVGEIKSKNGHTYYVFPIGTSVFAVPLVGLANLWGRDMAVPPDNYALQNLLSALSCALVFALVYHLAHAYLPVTPSLGIAIASTFGSSLVSTLGTAFWNFNLAIVFVLLALLVIIRRERLGIRPRPYLLGGLLFSAYFCRPSTATFILAVLVYLLIEDRRLFARTAAAAGGLLLAFLIISRVEYGQWLPDYYSAAKLSLHRTGPVQLVYGLFLSPSRGLLIFSPFLVVVLAVLVWRFGELRRQRLVSLSLGWVVLHLLVVSRSTRWWGGHGYGPRVLTDLLPAFSLLSILAATVVVRHPRPLLRRMVIASYVCLAAVAIFIHTYQGLFNPLTVRWNGAAFEPNIDQHPEYILDWRYPQFLASTGMLCARNADYKYKLVDPYYDAAAYYTPGETVDYAGSGQNTAFVGWSLPERGFRWSECPTARLLIKLGAADTAQRYMFELTVGAEHAQVARISVNGTYVGELAFEAALPQAPVTHAVGVAGYLLRPNGLNEIELKFPEAARPETQDPRLLGVALVSFGVYPEE